MIPEPIISVADLLPDDRRDAGVGLVGDVWAAGIHNVAAGARRFTYFINSHKKNAAKVNEPTALKPRILYRESTMVPGNGKVTG
jgi:hypothetical protein